MKEFEILFWCSFSRNPSFCGSFILWLFHSLATASFEILRSLSCNSFCRKRPHLFSCRRWFLVTASVVSGDCIGKEEEKEGDCVRILIGSLSIVHSCKVFHSSLSLATVSPSALFWKRCRSQARSVLASINALFKYMVHFSLFLRLLFLSLSLLFNLSVIRHRSRNHGVHLFLVYFHMICSLCWNF